MANQEREPFVLDFPNGQRVEDILKKADQLPTKAQLDQQMASKATMSDVERETQNLQNQINEIVRAPESGGDVAAEVAQARVGADGTTYQTLKERLDSEETDVQSAFESVLEITHGKNFVDESRITTLDVSGTGTLKRGYNLGDIEPGTYVVSYESAVGSYYFTIIQNGVYTQKALSNGSVLTLDENAIVYIRSDDMTFNITKLQFEKGSVPTAYEPFRKYGDSLRLDRYDDIESDVNSVFETVLEITHGKNYVDENTLMTLDVTGTGTLKRGYNLGDIEPGTYVVSYESAVGTYYFTIIQNGVYTQKGLTDGSVLSLDGNATVYIRSNDMTFNITKLQFEKGSVPTAYESYEKYGDSLRLDRYDDLEEATVNINNRLGIKKESKNLVEEGTLTTLDVTGTGILRKGYDLGVLKAGTYVVSYESAVGTYYFTIIKNNVYTQKSLTNGRTLQLDTGDTLYIRSNDMTFNITKLQFEKGSVPTAYEPYNLAYRDSSRIVDIESQITEIESTLSVPQNTYYADAIPSDKSPFLYGDILFCNNTKYVFNGVDFILFSESNEPYDKEEYYDVVIIGGGTGGVAAAYPFIGTNYRVAIVEKNSALGGVACLGYVSTWIEGYNTPMLENIFTSLKNAGKATGVLENSWLPSKFSTVAGSSLRFQPDSMSEKYESDLSGTNFDIYYDSVFVNYGEVVGDSIESVVVRSGGSTVKLHAKFFVDASTEASLIRSINGVRNSDYYYGRDYQSRFGESLAITGGDFRYLNEPSYFFEIEDAFDDSALLDSITTVYRDGNTVVAPSYIRTDGYPFVVGDRTFVNTMYGTGQQGMYKLLNSSWNYVNSLTKMTLEYWKYIKLHLQIEYEKGNSTFRGWSVAYRTYGFVRFADIIGDRETYRINCEDMLTQSDLATLAINDSDVIAVGSHNIDMHVTTGLNTTNITAFNDASLRPYAIRYGMIIPKHISNAFVASKCFGASQIANASARIAKVINQLGYVAGNAIKYSLNNGLSDVRDVNISEIKGNHYTDFNNRFVTLMSYYNG